MSSTDRLLPQDFDTRLWRWLDARLCDDLAKARADLEHPALDDKPNASIRLRARIKALEEYRQLPREAETAATQAHADTTRPQ